jgi:Chitobiase/beta-hexosaminidase C-terminal domain
MRSKMSAAIPFRRFASAFCLILLSTVLTAQLLAQKQTRTVVDQQVGSIFQAPPSGVSFSAIGAFDGSFAGIDPDALHIRYGTFQAFASDDWNRSNFPLAALQDYEAAEVAAGHPRIFVHATYAGKSRQVYFNFAGAMGSSSSGPTTAQAHWYQAVNACDPRFVRFWISHYQRPIIQAPFYSNAPVFWTQNDNGAFNTDLYGVVDDNNHFVTGLNWDPEFPQGSSAFFQCMASFYTQIAKLAPDIQVMLNIATWSDSSQYATVMQDLPGVMHEDLAYWSGNPSTYIREMFYNREATWFPWMISRGKSILGRSAAPDPVSLMNGFVTYELLIAGGNGFFGPGNGSNIVNPSLWLPWDANLGNPKSAMVSTQVNTSSIGYRHYSRTFDGGIVYLNLGGSTWTIPLTGKQWYDPRGNPISSITLADGQATFAMTSPPGIPQRPMISPRSAFTYQGPVSVKLSAGVSGTTIRYTTDGTEPTSSSAVYTNPIALNASSTVKARNFTSGGTPSYTSTAVYTVESSSPVVTFANSTDHGSAGTYYPVLQLTELPAGPVWVSYNVKQSDGSITKGNVSFLAQQTRPYRYFPITVTSGSATVTITGATGATVGPQNSLQYSVASSSNTDLPNAPTGLTAIVH